MSYMEDAADIIDLRGIARLLKVSKHTPNQWRQRELLPNVDYPELMRPAWRKSTIITWARSTGRWPPGSTARPEARIRQSDDSRRRQYRPVRPQRDADTGAPMAVFVPPASDVAA
jgi:hypothetical protein